MQIPKVLLVNDDAASLLALETALAGATRDNEYELITATSGQQALREVLTHEFAVILLDVNMPGMDGYQTAEAIHSHPRSLSVPIIFITAHYPDDLHRLKAYQAGAVDYLFTPVIPQILQTKVRVFVELTKYNLALVAKTDELARLYDDLGAQRLQDLERINGELELEVAERKLAEQRAHELSIRDGLTGLLNRRALIQQLEHAVAFADRHAGEFALLFLDLDQFKRVNDSFGHETGDELLRQVAARLLASVRVSDVVARLGGDEFVVLLEGPGAAANAAGVARKIEQANLEPFEIAGKQLRAAASIGIGLYPQDAPNAATLLRNADFAMYHAKRHRRGSIEFFREELNALEVERARWGAELQQALDNDELTLLFLPKADTASGALAGVEALLHWRHRSQGLLAAPAFLPQVTERVLLERVSEWTIGAACKQAAQWRRQGQALPISVNLAGTRIDPALAGWVATHLSKCGLESGWLELEIAEHLLADPVQARAVLQPLRAAGVRLAVDDFGSAGASLTALRDLPFDAIKIDCAFVRDLGAPGGADMVAAIIHLARALNLSVLAQGVDTEEQLALLRTLGCDQYQGALVSQPLAADTVSDLLASAGTNHSTITSRPQIRPPLPLRKNEDNVDE